MNSALLNCPFCDAGAEHLKHDEPTPGHWRIVCFRCSACGPTVEGKHELDLDVSALTQTRIATGPMGGWNMRGGWLPSHPSHPANNAPMKCPHCGSGLLWSEDRGAHCDGCEEYDAEREEAALTMELGPPISPENAEVRHGAKDADLD